MKLLKIRDYPEMRDFVFKMNDWLLGVQQWSTADYPDQPGRFYDPERRLRTAARLLHGASTWKA